MSMNYLMMHGLDFRVASVVAPYPVMTWTTLTPSVDTQYVAVSTSGDDGTAYVGTDRTQAEAFPFASYVTARNAMRPGYPDWLLLKAGDEWNLPGQGLILNDGNEGRSNTERQVFTRYGSGANPRLPGSSCNCGGNQFVQYIDFPEVTPTEDAYVSFGLAVGDNVTFEGCYFGHGNLGAANCANFAARANRSVDGWIWNGTSYDPVNALALFNVAGATIEFNVLDLCGWRPGTNPMTGTFHQTYIHNDCTDLVIRCNWSSRGSGEALMVRPGGLVEWNYLMNSAKGLTLGYHKDGPRCSGLCTLNVVESSNSSGGGGAGGYTIGYCYNLTVAQNYLIGRFPNDFGTGFNIFGGPDPQSPFTPMPAENVTIEDNYSWGWYGPDSPYGADGVDAFLVSGDWVGAAGTSVFRRNVSQLPGDTTSPNGPGYLIEVGGSAPGIVALSDNIYADRVGYCLKWNGTQYQFSGWAAASGETGATTTIPNYTDPNRVLQDYLDTLGIADFDAWMAEIRNMDQLNWDDRKTAPAASYFIQQGFAVAP